MGTIFSAVSNMTGLPQSTVAIILGIVLAVAIVAILYWFFGTEIGSALRATGNNEYMIRALGVNTNSTKMIALVLSNALIGLSGAHLPEPEVCRHWHGHRRHRHRPCRHCNR